MLTAAGPATDERRAQLARNLARVREQIAAACAAADRDEAGVTLIVVTKTYPAADVIRLASLGVTDIGENRDQEARAKHSACSGLNLAWHFVGQLQRNKAAAVVRYCDAIHSVDRSELIPVLQRAAAASGRRPRCLIQVDLGEPDGTAQPGRARGGALPSDVGALSAEIANAPDLELAGVMGVAPLGTPPAPAFAALREVAMRVQEQHPAATWISAGMSTDLVAAIKAGATHVRIGAAVLGERPFPR